MTCCTDKYTPYVFIILAVLSDFIGLLVAYFTSNIDPYPYVPYISELGNDGPNSSWFSLFLLFSAFFYIKIFEMRCALLEKKKNEGTKCTLRLNQIAYWLGMISIFGKFTVVSFQLEKEMLLHYIGASFYFVAFYAYIVLQTVLTYKFMAISRGERNVQSSRFNILTIIQTLLCVVAGVSLVIFLPFAVIKPLSKYNRNSFNVAQVTEFTMAVSHSFYMFTLIVDFYRASNGTNHVKDGSGDKNESHVSSNPIYGSIV